MSELISGKEALIALANGEAVQCKNKDLDNWHDVVDDCPISLLTTEKNRNGFWFEFRLKPRTITINGIEVPAPFEPKEREECCYVSDDSIDGYHTIHYNSEKYSGLVLGLYRPSEIKQVVAALRSIFK